MKNNIKKAAVKFWENKELVSGSRFPIPCFRFYSFEIFETFSQIRNKEPVAGSRFPVPDYQFYINICPFQNNLTVFIICRQITFYSLVSFNALHALQPVPDSLLPILML